MFVWLTVNWTWQIKLYRDYTYGLMQSTLIAKLLSSGVNDLGFSLILNYYYLLCHKQRSMINTCFSDWRDTTVLCHKDPLLFNIFLNDILLKKKIFTILLMITLYTVAEANCKTFYNLLMGYEILIQIVQNKFRKCKH